MALLVDPSRRPRVAILIGLGAWAIMVCRIAVDVGEGVGAVSSASGRTTLITAAGDVMRELMARATPTDEQLEVADVVLRQASELNAEEIRRLRGSAADDR